MNVLNDITPHEIAHLRQKADEAGRDGDGDVRRLVHILLDAYEFGDEGAEERIRDEVRADVEDRVKDELREETERDFDRELPARLRSVLKEQADEDEGYVKAARRFIDDVSSKIKRGRL